MEKRRVKGGKERRRRVIGEGRETTAEKEEEVAMKQPGLS